MRITELIHRESTISRSQYEKLKYNLLKVVYCCSDGWDFSNHEQTTEKQARKWVRETRQKRKYEKKHPDEFIKSVMIVHYIDQLNEPKPDWPDELKPLQKATDNILEAYFCHKFDIPCE